MNEWHQVNDNGEKEQLVRYTVVLRFAYRAVEQMSLVILIPCTIVYSWCLGQDGKTAARCRQLVTPRYTPSL